METFSKSVYNAGTYDVVFRNGDPVMGITFVDDLAPNVVCRTPVVTTDTTGRVRVHYGDGKLYMACDDPWDVVFVPKIPDAWVALVLDESGKISVKHYQSERFARHHAPADGVIVNLRDMYRQGMAATMAAAC